MVALQHGRAVQAHLELLVLQYRVLLELVPQCWLSRSVYVTGSQHREGQVADEAAQLLRAKIKLMVAEGLQATGCSAHPGERVRAHELCVHKEQVV